VILKGFRKGLEGSSSDVIEVLTSHLSGRPEEKNEELFRIVSVLTEIQPEHFQSMSQEHYSAAKSFSTLKRSSVAMIVISVEW
jgi:hypothetical protein